MIPHVSKNVSLKTVVKNKRFENLLLNLNHAVVNVIKDHINVRMSFSFKSFSKTKKWSSSTTCLVKRVYFLMTFVLMELGWY
jgi:hypothetical protein